MSQDGSPEEGYSTRCFVTKIVDGDTVEVSIHKTMRVRIRDCWAPEKKDPGGKEATTKLTELCMGEEALLFIPTQEHIGKATTMSRIVGDLYVKGKSIAKEMVKLGFATSEKVNVKR